MSFAAALIDPFDPKAKGARVPDTYFFPTATTHIKQSFALSSDSNGNFDMTFFPNPFYTFLVKNPALINGLSNEQPSSSGASKFGLLNQTNSQNWSQYRVVGAGLRLRSQLVPQTSTGTLYGATVPSREYEQNPTFFGETPTYADQLTNDMLPNSVDSTGYISTVMESYATGLVMEAFELNRSGLQLAAKVTNPRAFDWNWAYNPTFTDGNTVWEADVVDLINAGGTWSLANYQPGNRDFLKTDGWTNACFRGVGFPASVKVFTVEVEFHIEYIELTPSNLGQSRFGPVDPALFEAAIQTAIKTPFYRALDNPQVESQMQGRLGF